MGSMESDPLLSPSKQPHTQDKYAKRFCLRTAVILFVLGITSIILFAQKTYSTPKHNGGLSRIEDCPVEYENETEVPSVGLALSLTHATAAIWWPDGSSEPISAIRAEDEYAEVMKRLAQTASRHVRPPYYGILLGPGLSERLRQLLRSSRKKIGLPATIDVGKLAEPLKPLLEKVNTRLGCKQTDMTLVTVGVQALYDEDVEDIMQYIGLQQLPLRHYPWPRMGCEQPHELASAYAAHDLGLCHTFWNATACAMEEAAMPFELVLSFSYTSKGIALSQAGFHSAYIGMGYYETMYDKIGFEGWGSDYKSDYDTDADYWSSVQTMLADRIRPNPVYNYTRLFILDNVLDEDAQHIQDIMEGILDAWQPGVVTVYRNQSLFTAAIGAAKFAQHGRRVKMEAPVSLGSKLHTMNPDPLGCPWYGYTLD